MTCQAEETNVIDATSSVSRYGPFTYSRIGTGDKSIFGLLVLCQMYCTPEKSEREGGTETSRFALQLSTSRDYRPYDTPDTFLARFRGTRVIPGFRIYLAANMSFRIYLAANMSFRIYLAANMSFWALGDYEWRFHKVCGFSGWFLKISFAVKKKCHIDALISYVSLIR